MFSFEVKDLLFKFIVFNLIVFEGDVDGEYIFIGFKMEIVMFILVCEYFVMGFVVELCFGSKIFYFIFFDFGCKCMGVVVQLENGKVCFYVKGVFEIMLEKCIQIFCDFFQGLVLVIFYEENCEIIKYLIEIYVCNLFCIIGLIYCDFDKWFFKLVCCVDVEKDEIVFEDICCNMVFVGMVGIKDFFCFGVFEVVRDCQWVGVVVCMVIGDNRLIVEVIVWDCGIFQFNSVVFEGFEFCNMIKVQ